MPRSEVICDVLSLRSLDHADGVGDPSEAERDLLCVAVAGVVPVAADHHVRTLEPVSVIRGPLACTTCVGGGSNTQDGQGVGVALTFNDVDGVTLLDRRDHAEKPVRGRL